jgi:hypothetical protein
MNFTPYQILVVIAIILTVFSFVKPAWPLLQVAVLLGLVAMLISKG